MSGRDGVREVCPLLPRVGHPLARVFAHRAWRKNSGYLYSQSSRADGYCVAQVSQTGSVASAAIASSARWGTGRSGSSSFLYWPGIGRDEEEEEERIQGERLFIWQ